MIGNDIVDLVLARKESNWKRKGFLDKIFTDSEQLCILNSENQENTVWSLWSRKEAAYKIYNRETGNRLYNPLQFECFDLEVSIEFIFGKVTRDNYIYYTKTIVNQDYIYTVAVVNRNDFDTICELVNTDNIIKKETIPNWIDKKKSILKPASISHHGRFTKIISI